MGQPNVRDIYKAMTHGERAMFWLAIVNFVLFVAIAVWLGGDAINGTTRDGRYYLMQHGIYSEVSRPVFIYSIIHTLSLFLTHPAGMFVAFRARSRARH